MMLEVRCCCDPGRLLGYLEVPHYKLFAGAELAYVIAPQLQILREAYGFEATLSEHQHVRLKVLPILIDDDEHLAVNSNDVDVALLRQLPGFTERRQHGEEEKEGEDQADSALQSRGGDGPFAVGLENKRQRQARRAGEEAGRRAAFGAAPWYGAGPEQEAR